MEHNTPFSNLTNWLFTAFNSAGFQTQEYMDKHGAESFQWIKTTMMDGQFTHLAFYLKSQCFGIWIVPVNDMGMLVQKDELERFVNTCMDNSIIPCLVKLKWNDFSPVDEYLFTDPFTNGPLNPITMTTDDPIQMTDWELNSFGIDASEYILQNSGHKIVGRNTTIGMFPQLILEENGELQFVKVDTFIVKRIEGMDENETMEKAKKDNPDFNFDKTRYPQLANRTIFKMRLFVLADEEDKVLRNHPHKIDTLGLVKC